jgi:putative hydrolase of the HAD superfamily
MPIKAIIFDFDDTLADEAGSFAVALQRAGAMAVKKHGIELQKLVESVRSIAREEWHKSSLREIGRSRGISSSEVFSGGFWEQDVAADLSAESDRLRPVVWRQALAAQGITDEPLVMWLAEASFAEGTGPHKPYPGTAEIVAKLAQSFPLGVITNGHSDIQRRKVRRSGLEEHFRSVVVSGDPGLLTAKPDPRPFQRSLTELGVFASEAVMIGNDPVNDVSGGAGVGMRTVWVNRAGGPFTGPVKPDHEIADLCDLPAALGL